MICSLTVSAGTSTALNFPVSLGLSWKHGREEGAGKEWAIACRTGRGDGNSLPTCTFGAPQLSSQSRNSTGKTAGEFKMLVVVWHLGSFLPHVGWMLEDSEQGPALLTRPRLSSPMCLRWGLSCSATVACFCWQARAQHGQATRGRKAEGKGADEING